MRMKTDGGRHACFFIFGSASLYPLSCRWRRKFLRPDSSIVRSGWRFSRKVAATFVMVALTVALRRERAVVVPKLLCRILCEKALMISPRSSGVKDWRNSSWIPHCSRNWSHFLKCPVCFLRVDSATPLELSPFARLMLSNKYLLAADGRFGNGRGSGIYKIG